MENQLQTNQKKIDAITYLTFFLSGLLGMTLGYVVFRLELTILAIIGTVLSAFLITGLLLSKRLLEQNNLLYQGFQQENAIKRYNILQAFIRELEHNMNAERVGQFRAGMWRNLKVELFVFPESLYEILETVYQDLSRLPEMDEVTLREYMIKESQVPVAIAALREQQQKIKRLM